MHPQKMWRNKTFSFLISLDMGSSEESFAGLRRRIKWKHSNSWLIRISRSKVPWKITVIHSFASPASPLLSGFSIKNIILDRWKAKKRFTFFRSEFLNFSSHHFHFSVVSADSRTECNSENQHKWEGKVF